jgi:hypothetical protein
MQTKPQLLDNEQAAKFLNISPTTLVTWRCRKSYAVPYFKIGTRIYYDVADLLAWLESRKVGATVDAR